MKYCMRGAVEMLAQDEDKPSAVLSLRPCTECSNSRRIPAKKEKNWFVVWSVLYFPMWSIILIKTYIALLLGCHSL